jgi:hypothetical protein
MKKRNRTAAIIVIILGSFSFWFIVNNHKGTIKETLRDFAVADTASVNKIFLADKEGKSVTLERKPSGVWFVNGQYPARTDAIQSLLYTIKKIDIKEPVGKASQDNVIKRLAAKAVRCEIYQNDKLTKAYYVGTETQDQTGTYMILMDPETMQPSAKAFITYIPGFEGYLTTRYFTEEMGWRDRTVYQYNPNDIKSVRVEVPANPEFGYELLIKGNNDYQVTMLSNKQHVGNLDSMAVKQYLSYFQQLNFESFEVEINQKQIDSVLKSQPVNILTVTDVTGKTNKLTFFARKPKKEGKVDEKGNVIIYDLERMDALMNNGKDFVMVQYYVFGKVMPPANYFQKKSNQTMPSSAKVNGKHNA